MTLLLNRELVSRVKLCLVSVLPDLVKDCPKIRNLPKIFLISFENVAPDTQRLKAKGHSRLPYNLYCVGGDVKHCSINQ